MNLLEYVSKNNQECKERPEIVDVNSEPAFFSFSRESKCSSNSSNINDLYAKLCVPDVFKNLNAKVFNLMSRAKVFNLMSRTDETRDIEWYETCRCKFRLDVSVCENKQR